jgi:hypothetical protein
VAALAAGDRDREPLQRTREPEPVGQFRQQPHAGVADQLFIGDNDVVAGLDRLHRALLVGGPTFDKPDPPSSGGSAHTQQHNLTTLRESRG